MFYIPLFIYSYIFTILISDTGILKNDSNNSIILNSSLSLSISSQINLKLFIRKHLSCLRLNSCTEGMPVSQVFQDLKSFTSLLYKNCLLLVFLSTEFTWVYLPLAYFQVCWIAFPGCSKGMIDLLETGE